MLRACIASGGDRRLQSRAEHLRIQRAADRQHANRAESRTQFVADVDARASGCPGSSFALAASKARVLQIDRTGHDQSMQRFQFPTASHEFTRQPFQQFGMRRRVTPRAEIVHGPHQPLRRSDAARRDLR